MALTNYTLCKQALPVLVDVSTADLATLPAGIDDLFSMAEERVINDIMDRGGIRAWEATLNGTMSGSGALSIPTGYLELKHAYINRSPVQWLERKSAEQIYRDYPDRQADGTPIYIAREGEQFIFGPYPDSQYLVTGICYTKPSTVVGTGNTTFTGVFASNPTLLLYATASEAETFLKRPQQRQEWEARYMAVLDRVIGQEMRERWSGSNLRVRQA
jgi:hypothetical protein